MGDSGRSHGGLKFLESIDCNDSNSELSVCEASCAIVALSNRSINDLPTLCVFFSLHSICILLCNNNYVNVEAD